MSVDDRVERRLRELERRLVTQREGVVTGVSPLEVSIGGGSPVEALGINGDSYSVNDRVTVLVSRKGAIVIGKPTDDPSGAGTSYSAGAGLDLVGTEFSVDLKSSGGLKIDSTELAADFGTTAGKVTQGNDSRLSDDRDPNAHAVSHKDGGSDELLLNELGQPNGDVDFNGWELIHVGDGQDADSAVNLGQLQLSMAGFTWKPQADYATVQALDAHTGSGTGTLEASANGDLLDALGLEEEGWDYALTFLAIGTPYAICRDSSGYFYVTFKIGSQYRVGKFDSSGQPVAAFSGNPFFGANGSGNGQFGGECYGITVDSSGNIYVADTSNNRIQKFNSSGTYQAQVGSLGSGNGQFSFPAGLARDSSNNIYVADTGNKRVQKLNSSLTYQAKVGSFGYGNGEFFVVLGVAVDGSGNVWVSDGGDNKRVQRFNTSLSYQSQFSTAPIEPRAITTDSSGNVLVADAAEAGVVQKFDSSGVYQAQVGSFGAAHGQFSYPQGIAVDSSGNLYVADTLNNRVEKLLHSATDITAGQSVIVKDEVFGGPHVDHGIYEITDPGGPSSKWELTRRDDVDEDAEVPSGLFINAARRGPYVPGGSWYIATPDPITVGTTPIVFEQYQPGGPPSPHAFQHLPDGPDPIPVEDWIEVGSGGSAPAFTNGWTNFGSGYSTAGFYKDPLGRVHLKGIIKSGTAGSAMFTLPTGYRPAQDLIVGTNANLAVASVGIHASGIVGGGGVTAGSNTWFSLDGISFRAA